MPDTDQAQPASTEEMLAELRKRAENLEHQLAETRRRAEDRLIDAELRSEALRAGIADPDGLKLLDRSAVKLNENGDVENAAALIADMKRTRPWLFPAAGKSSSAAVSPPPVQPPRTKLATEMSEDEWRSARAALLKRHG